VFRVRDADCRDRQHQGDIRIREKRSTRYKTIASLIIGGTTVFKSSPYVFRDRSCTGKKKEKKREKERKRDVSFFHKSITRVIKQPFDGGKYRADNPRDDLLMYHFYYRIRVFILDKFPYAV